MDAFRHNEPVANVATPQFQIVNQGGNGRGNTFGGSVVELVWCRLQCVGSTAATNVCGSEVEPAARPKTAEETLTGSGDMFSAWLIVAEATRVLMFVA